MYIFTPGFTKVYYLCFYSNMKLGNGEWEWGMGNREWGIGNGNREWGMGIGNGNGNREWE